MKYSIVVSINKEVWGAWTLNEKPNATQETIIRKTISKALKASSFPDYEWHVDIIENIHCDSLASMVEGIQESIENEFDQDFD